MEFSKFKKQAEAHQGEMVDIRRHLHRNPELSYQEHETTSFIVEKLKELDITVDQPLSTGCVGVLEGGKDSDKVIALRADIDALPITEEGKHKEEFLSDNPGIAHCCGHDAHTANMLGAVRLLSEVRDQIEGIVLFIFQPGEEKLPGGGRLLCETGYLQEKGVDVIYGLHSYPGLEPGQIAIRKGALMARPDEFAIELIGKGGHAASPHEAVDPIVMASQVISQIQTIVSRSVNPTEPAVVTVGKINGGSAHNVIPAKVEMLGTVRTFAKETADMIRDRIEAITKGVAEASGGAYTFDFDYGYPAVINTEWAAENVMDTADELLGKQNVKLLDEPIMAGEDFAFYQQEFPGAFFFLGSGREETGSTYSWHHPQYNIDEDCFATGAALMASLVFQPIPE
ncbi:M20 metallopeptidase family protein [Fodinibius halophilus]|uniref:Amidohydrolase n=1 Tax=Fodinibius halophilus TaxID=1736908 RepID=A0A6M1T5Y0_9BACT|nr:amidohydrolase [Fodinibius halophilus]NGP89527.1 amidohydrolase [Fodinibius halophilus]